MSENFLAKRAAERKAADDQLREQHSEYQTFLIFLGKQIETFYFRNNNNISTDLDGQTKLAVGVNGNDFIKVTMNSYSTFSVQRSGESLECDLTLDEVADFLLDHIPRG